MGKRDGSLSALLNQYIYWKSVLIWMGLFIRSWAVSLTWAPGVSLGAGREERALKRSCVAGLVILSQRVPTMPSNALEEIEKKKSSLRIVTNTMNEPRYLFRYVTKLLSCPSALSVPCIQQKRRNMNFWKWWYLRISSVEKFDWTHFLNQYHFMYLHLSKAKENTISFNTDRNLKGFIKKTVSSTTLQKEGDFIQPDIFDQMQMYWPVARKYNILGDYWIVIVN